MAEKVPPLTQRIEQILKKQKELNAKKSANQDNFKKTKIVDSLSSAQSSLSKCQDDIFSDTKNRSVCKFKKLSVTLGPETKCGKSKEKSVKPSDNNLNCLGVLNKAKKEDKTDIQLNTDTKLEAHIFPEPKHLNSNFANESSKKDDQSLGTTTLAEICDPGTGQSNSISLEDNKNVKSQERRKVVVHANSSYLSDIPEKKQIDTIQLSSKVEKKAVQDGGKSRRRGFLIGNDCDNAKDLKEELLPDKINSADDISENNKTVSYDTLVQESKMIDSKEDESDTLQVNKGRKLTPPKGEENIKVLDNVQTELSAINDFVSTCVGENHRDSLENIHIQFEDSESLAQGKKAMKTDCKNYNGVINSYPSNDIRMQFDESPLPSNQVVKNECKEATDEIKSYEADDLKMQFDDSESMSVEKRCCLGDEKNASLISKDTFEETTASLKAMTPPLKRKVKRSKRRSSDFQIISAAITLSPLQSPSEPDRNLMFSGPTYRRSRRLKRKSIEIYRTSKLYNTEAEDVEEQTPIESIESNQSKQEEVEAVGDIADVKLLENKSIVDDDSVPATEAVETVKNMQKAHLEGDKKVPSTESKQEILESVTKSTETPQETLQSTNRPKRKAAQGINYISELVDNFEESPSSSNNVSIKGKRGKKAKLEPTVEEIYHNKLWRSQMPKDKSWETIFETPQITKTGSEELLSSKKFKRHVNFDEFYTNIRLKKRKQKALQRGWKPLTRKRQEVAGKLLFEKLTALQDMLDIQSQFKAQVEDDVNSLENNEEKLLTPVKDINELARFKDGQIMVSSKSDDNKDIAEEGDDDVFEMPLQSDLPVPKFVVSVTNHSGHNTLALCENSSPDSKATSKDQMQSNLGCKSDLAFSPQY